MCYESESTEIKRTMYVRRYYLKVISYNIFFAYNQTISKV